MKVIQFVMALLCFTAAGAVMAQQPNPSVEIILSQPAANKGDFLSATVYVRNAINLGGADIGMTVDDHCLRIINRTDGEFLPTTSETGGFSPFSEMHNDETRLAASVIDRSKIANGNGMFYNVQLEVTCDQGVAPLKVSFAEFSAYKDPKAAQIELVAYTLGAKTVMTKGAQLSIGGALANEANAPESVTPVNAATPESPIKALILITLTGVGIAILGTAFFLMRRRSAPTETPE